MADTFNNGWVFDIQTTIFSRIKAICTAKLRSKYPDIKITQNSRDTNTSKYPTVYVHFLQPTEVGKDLDGQTVNAIYQTVQIEIFVTQAQGMVVANEVSSVVLDIMKEMRFVATMPEFQDTDANYRTVSRYSRTIGNSDVLFEVPTV